MKRLVTIPFSHYCEKARWALDRARMTYTEEPHLPILHVPFALRASGQRLVPILVTPHGAITDSTRILEWVDGMLPEERRLFPHDPTLRAEVARWESRFDDELGPHARRWGYWHVLPHRERVVSILGKHVPAWEKAVFSAGYPAAAALMRRGLRLTADGAARSLEKVRRVFADVSDALGDGRRYLTGDRFTAADVAFASLAGPAVLPDGYAKWLCGRDEAPPSMHALIDELRATPAGRFVDRVYADERA